MSCLQGGQCSGIMKKERYNNKNMKKFKLIILLLSLLILSCQRKQTKQNKIATSIESIIVDIESDSIDIFGKWYYTEYTDSTIKYRKIYDYSWSIASFAYEITIDKENPDSATFKGYHEWWTGKLEKISDYVYRYGSDDWHWILRFEKSGNITQLYVKHYVDPKYTQEADPNEYVLTKKDLFVGNKSLNFSERITFSVFSGLRIIDNEELYFAKHIIAGEYIDIDTERKIIFKENLELIEIDSFNRYSIHIDFWEMVPQMDIISFYEGEDYNKINHYNWEFKGDSLILRSIIPLYNDGETIGPDVKYGDYWGAKIDTVFYRLKKIR